MIFIIFSKYDEKNPILKIELLAILTIVVIRGRILLRRQVLSPERESVRNVRREGDYPSRTTPDACKNSARTDYFSPLPGFREEQITGNCPYNLAKNTNFHNFAEKNIPKSRVIPINVQLYPA